MLVALDNASVEATLEEMTDSVVPRGMHLLKFRHAQAFNARYDRVGHLFQGRFDARVIEGDEHFITVCEYVFDNPVRAGLCDARADWPWLGGELLTDLR